ncbi:MAG: efflux RND transporter periplasmic adaptor subunit [Gemmatales bacterium]
MILDKTISVGDMVDTNLDLFKIGDLSTLKVWAHVYEEDLPELIALPKPVPWNISLPSIPGKTFLGTLQKIGAVIDPNQHTALVIGRVDNPDGQLRIGQYVTVTIDVAPHVGELEVPTEAVVEDGNQSVVFVQAKDNENLLVRKTVCVLRRCKEVITLRAEPGRIMAGERIVTSGALLIKDAMDEQPVPATASVTNTSAKP